MGLSPMLVSYFIIWLLLSAIVVRSAIRPELVADRLLAVSGD